MSPLNPVSFVVQKIGSDVVDKLKLRGIQENVEKGIIYCRTSIKDKALTISKLFNQIFNNEAKIEFDDKTKEFMISVPSHIVKQQMDSNYSSIEYLVRNTGLNENWHTHPRNPNLIVSHIVPESKAKELSQICNEKISFSSKDDCFTAKSSTGEGWRVIISKSSLSQLALNAQLPDPTFIQKAATLASTKISEHKHSLTTEQFTKLKVTDQQQSKPLQPKKALEHEHVVAPEQKKVQKETQIQDQKINTKRELQRLIKPSNEEVKLFLDTNSMDKFVILDNEKKQEVMKQAFTYACMIGPFKGPKGVFNRAIDMYTSSNLITLNNLNLEVENTLQEKHLSKLKEKYLSAGSKFSQDDMKAEVSELRQSLRMEKYSELSQDIISKYVEDLNLNDIDKQTFQEQLVECFYAWQLYKSAMKE